MRIKVTYCKNVRKDGTCNSVMFDTEAKTFTNDDMPRGEFIFVEAAQSHDINILRNALIRNGYTEED